MYWGIVKTATTQSVLKDFQLLPHQIQLNLSVLQGFKAILELGWPVYHGSCTHKNITAVLPLAASDSDDLEKHYLPNILSQICKSNRYGHVLRSPHICF